MKLKKIIAAIAAAATVSAMGVTAFAAVNDTGSFYFYLNSYESDTSLPVYKGINSPYSSCVKVNVNRSGSITNGHVSLDVYKDGDSDVVKSRILVYPDGSNKVKADDTEMAYKIGKGGSGNYRLYAMYGYDGKAEIQGTWEP